MALKLTANSMYGCLGYTKSRFYARPLAMLTTYKGREILQSTKDLAESAHGLRVIYGDTDSVMVNTNVDNIMDAMKIGNEFKKSVNERYELLEIDIDNIFRRLLLHAKKKYAAVNMIEKDGKWIDKLEVKGLDMRRREYCQLSKDTSTELLNFLLSGEDPETVVSQIHEHLREVASQMRANAIPLRKYTIYTQLGKNPKEYPNGGSMPSVQVALKLMAKGKYVKAKDVMSYIICNDSSGSAEKAAKNAFPVDEVLRAENELIPDIDYYLHKQILPPVERLCAPIEGTNVTLLAECLGLDTSKYRVSSNSGSNSYNTETEIQPLESQVPDEIRFKDCAPLGLLCLSCRTPFSFRGLGSASSSSLEDAETQTATVDTDGIHCPSSSCGALLPLLALSAQLESQIRAHTAQYYAATLVCDEATCGNRTRQMSVYGHRCLGPRGLAFGCTGKMGLEYSEKMLYNQLLFLERCFDVEKVKATGQGVGQAGQGQKKTEDAERVGVLAEMNRKSFGILRAVVEAYLDKSGWGWVSMDGLFGFALKALQG
jgi:DNA polymerase alpha subunit A